MRRQAIRRVAGSILKTIAVLVAGFEIPWQQWKRRTGEAFNLTLLSLVGRRLVPAARRCGAHSNEIGERRNNRIRQFVLAGRPPQEERPSTGTRAASVARRGDLGACGIDLLRLHSCKETQ